MKTNSFPGFQARLVQENTTFLQSVGDISLSDLKSAR